MQTSTARSHGMMMLLISKKFQCICSKKIVKQLSWITNSQPIDNRNAWCWLNGKHYSVHNHLYFDLTILFFSVYIIFIHDCFGCGLHTLNLCSAFDSRCILPLNLGKTVILGRPSHVGWENSNPTHTHDNYRSFFAITIKFRL